MSDAFSNNIGLVAGSKLANTFQNSKKNILSIEETIKGETTLVQINMTDRIYTSTVILPYTDLTKSNPPQGFGSCVVKSGAGILSNNPKILIPSIVSAGFNFNDLIIQLQFFNSFFQLFIMGFNADSISFEVNILKNSLINS